MATAKLGGGEGGSGVERWRSCGGLLRFGEPGAEVVDPSREEGGGRGKVDLFYRYTVMSEMAAVPTRTTVTMEENPQRVLAIRQQLSRSIGY
jgi:hypothetical protein